MVENMTIPERYADEYELARKLSTGWGTALERADFEAAFDPSRCKRLIEELGRAEAGLARMQASACGKDAMVATVREKLPGFVQSCLDSDSDSVILYQDAFAGDYQEEEFALLGMAIKFAGLNGKTIQIVANSRKTA